MSVIFVRFIPALAGNTSDCAKNSIAPTVHPRARGEHLYRQPQRVAIIGSSPRSRGTHRTQVLHRMARRFIPALAGNTNVMNGKDSIVSVHPRARGEHNVI